MLSAERYGRLRGLLPEQLRDRRYSTVDEPAYKALIGVSPCCLNGIRRALLLPQEIVCPTHTRSIPTIAVISQCLIEGWIAAVEQVARAAAVSRLCRPTRRHPLAVDRGRRPSLLRRIQ